MKGGGREGDGVAHVIPELKVEGWRGLCEWRLWCLGCFGVDKIEHSLGHWRIVHHLIASQLNNIPSPFRLPLPSPPASFSHTKKGAHMWKPGRDVLCMRRHIRMRLIVLMDRRLCRIFAPCPRWPSTCGCSWLESPFPATTVLAVISNGLHIFTYSAPEHPQADDIRGNDANDDGGCGESCTQKLEATDSRCLPAKAF